MSMIVIFAFMSVSCNKDHAPQNVNVKKAILGTWVISEYQWYSDGQLVPDEYDESEDMYDYSIGTVYDFIDDKLVLIRNYYGFPLNWYYDTETNILYIGNISEETAIPIISISSKKMVWGGNEYKTQKYFDFETNTIEHSTEYSHTAKQIYTLTRQ